MKVILPQDWRTQNRALRRVYAKYMTWLERLGYVVVALVIVGFVFAFNYPVDETVSAEKVKLELSGQAITFDTPVHVIEMLVPEDAEVRKGQEIFTYQAGDGGRPVAFVSPIDGIVKMSAPTDRSNSVPAGTELGRVYDPKTVVFSASLSGQSVSRANKADKVKISNIVVEPTAGVTYRLATPSGTVVSSQVFDDSLLKAATEAIKGYDLRLRDDRPFAPSAVTDLTIEATGDKGALAVDPKSDLVCDGLVVSGEAKAVVQAADLPAPLADRLRATVKDAMARQGLQPPADLRFVIKLKAELGAGSDQLIQGTALTRTFDIQGKVVDPPESLLLAVRRAFLAGKSVTAKVDLKTGSRPLATILLKKS